MTAEDDPTATEAQKETLGDFELLNALGGGGMGTVYRARQLSMNREVAVKVLHEHLASDANFVDRFYREAHASGKLTHPNIIRGIAAGKAGGRFYFAMEFVDGETAAQLAHRRGRLSAGEVLTIGLDVARALQHAHSRHIIHRDIKPSNIMIDREGVVKLADLGLAKAQAEDSSLTHPGGVYGTLAYMAPEQHEDASNADPRSDIYSLGVTLYYLLTGAKPFAGSSSEEVLNAKRSGVYRPIREYNPAVPEPLERIINKMMRPDLRQRFQSAAEVVAALEAIDPSGRYRNAPQTVVAPYRSRAFLGLGAVGLAIVGAVAFAVSQRPWPPWLARRALPQPEPTAQLSGQETPRSLQQVTLGVMLFQIRRGGANDGWKRDAVRDKLNAQLSELSQVKVYSKEFIDFLITRKGMTEIEAAEQLGIKKMLSGSVDVTGDALQIETHVVDVSSGLLVASYTTTGSEAKLDQLSNNLAMETIAHLDLPVTDQERQKLLAFNETTNADALKLLLEAEGGRAEKPPSVGPRSDANFDAKPFGLALLSRFWVSTASAAEESGAQSEVKHVIERYRDAFNARDIKALSGFYADFSKEQEDALRRYFANVRDLRVTIADVDVAVVGDEAVVSFTRTDDFVDPAGQTRHLSVRLTKQLRHENGGWKLVRGN